MKTKAVGLLVVCLLAFAAGTPVVAAEVTQTTGSGSWCSPAQSGNGNTVICNGVDPRAEHYLNDLLDRMDLDLKQKTAEANEWARRYNDLNAQLEETKKQLAARGEDATLVQTAQNLLHEGKLEEAHAIYDRLIQLDEANVDRAAQDFFGRASVFALQFRLDQALPDYARASQYRPDNVRYAKAYAYALLNQRDYLKAQAVLEGLVMQQRSAATQGPTDRLDLAWTLNDLGVQYDDTRRFAQAETALKEAASIGRVLVAQNLAASQPTLAATFNNLGVLYWETHRFAEAEAADKEAAATYRELAAQSPAVYRPDLAKTLNNLGLLYDDTHRFGDAEAAYKEAAATYRELVEQNPAAYRPDLALTLNNLGNLYNGTRRFDDAEAAYKEAVAIQRELVEQNPAAYRPDLALTLNNMAALYGNSHRFAEAEAEAALKEAAAIRRKLVEQNPAAYRPDLAVTLFNLGALYFNSHRFADAEAAYNEAAAIRRKLVEQNPAAYRPDLVQTLNNLASLYRKMHRDTDAKAVEAEALAAAK